MFDWLGNTQLSAWLRNELWVWPLALTAHALGTALVVGFTLIVTLRLLGVFTLFPYTALSRLFPVIWGALALQVLSGFVLLMTKPAQYVADGAFVLKLMLVITATIATYLLHRTIKWESDAWEMKRRVSLRGTYFAAAVLLTWCCVLIAGRLTAQLGTIG